MSRSVQVSLYYDGGGTVWATIPEKEWLRVRDTTDEKGNTYQEALVTVGGDSGGKRTEWVRIPNLEMAGGA